MLYTPSEYLPFFFKSLPSCTLPSPVALSLSLCSAWKSESSVFLPPWWDKSCKDFQLALHCIWANGSSLSCHQMLGLLHCLGPSLYCLADSPSFTSYSSSQIYQLAVFLIQFIHVLHMVRCTEALELVPWKCSLMVTKPARKIMLMLRSMNLKYAKQQKSTMPLEIIYRVICTHVPFFQWLTWVWYWGQE